MESLNWKALALTIFFTTVFSAAYLTLYSPSSREDFENVVLVDLNSKSSRCFTVHASGAAYMEDSVFVTHVKNETGYGIGVWADGFPPHSWDTGAGQRLEVDVSKLSEDRLWLEIVLER
ncbi:MAG: hypothetical protein ACPL07_03465, partial [Candidatus Bathyarchaeia archaeon]